MMKAVLLLSVFVCVVAGCGKPEQAGPAPANTPAVAVPANLPSLQAGTEAAPTPGQATAVAPVAPPAVDFAAKDRPVNAAGDPMSDLELLNQALANFNEARATGATAASGQLRTYKTEAEQMAAEAAQQQSAGPVTDLQELVRARIIKAVPPAPAGRKYAIDPKTHKVVLISAP